MFKMSGFSGSEIRRLADFLTVVIVSSPCSSHPETTLIEKAILSLSRFSCLDQCPIVIVLDGYVIRESSRTKKGQITEDMSIQYDAYHQRLSALYGDNDQIRIRRSEKHLGFALAVKFGLSFCTTTYAMIAQHDRIFLNSFHRLQDLIDAMESNDHIRYIGFPTVANRTHDSVLNSRYRVSYLDSSDVKMSLGENLYLQPLIFWFDSQHLCHIQRYLQIYKPFLTLPEEMKEWLGTKAVNDMVLRVGDFIEDRFGQSQRNCLTTKGMSDTFMLAAFRWFGTYLAWVPDDKAKSSRDGRGASVMVGHLRGRQLNPTKIEVYRADVSKRLMRLKECNEGYEPSPYSEEDDDEGCGKIFSDGQDEDEGEDEEEDDIEVESEYESERVVHVNEGNTGCSNVRGDDCVEGKGDKGEREGDKIGKEEGRKKNVVADISPAFFDGLTKPSDRCLLRTKSVH